MRPVVLLVPFVAALLVGAAPSAASHGAAHTITIQIVGEGIVADDAGQIDCPSDCTGDYDAEAFSIALSATADTGYEFDGWEGCPGPFGDTCDVELQEDQYVIAARFVPEGSQTPPPPPTPPSPTPPSPTPPPTTPPPTGAQRTLTVRVVGPGSVRSDPAGIACGSDCSENFATNALVVVTAMPEEDAQFAGWSGDCVGTGASCAITMSAARSLTATFRRIPPALRLTAPGASAGGGAAATATDVLLYDNGVASLVFDGSDVGLASASEAIDALAFLADGSLLVSTAGAATVRADYRTTATGRGATVVARGEDVLRFRFARAGTTTRGTWSLYVDGSDVGLAAASENIDALATAGRDLLVSTAGAVAVRGASGLGEDVLRFRRTRLGTTTRGTWTPHFDGSDAGFTGSAENVVGLDAAAGAVFLVTSGSFSAPGASGEAGDVVRATCSSLGATTTCRLTTLVARDDLDLGGTAPGSIDLR